MKKFLRFISYSILPVTLSIAVPQKVSASTLEVTLDTSSIFGEQGSFIFDFIDGGSGVENSVTIFNSNSDGTGGLEQTSGNVTGTLDTSLVLGKDPNSILTELTKFITFGNYITFTLDITENGPGLEGTPDSFSLFVVDGAGDLAPTTDPTGSNALFIFNIDGSSTGNLSIYTLPNGAQPWQVTPVSAVPVPSAVWLFITGVIGVGVNLRKTRKI